MNLRYAHSIEELPLNIQTALENAVVFYSKDYEQYVIKKGGIPIFIFDDSYLLLFILVRRYLFKFADVPAEYAVHDNDNAKASPREFLDACVSVLRNVFHVQWINQPQVTAIFGTCPSCCLKIPFGTILIDLAESEDSLFSKMDRKFRVAIRRAQKGEIQVKYGKEEYISDFTKLESETLRRSSINADYTREYQVMLETLNKETIIFIAYKDSIPQGGALFLYNRAMSYCLYAGSINRPEPGAMNLLHWQAMLYMRNCGVRYYNFVGYRLKVDEGSKYAGIQRFKDGFGGQLRECYLFKVVLNNPMYQFSRLGMRLKTAKQYQGDIIDQEIHKWKELNRE